MESWRVERLTSLPEVPEAFGEDGGHFDRYYDALADEIDEDMVKSLKAQLDGILIYAGLFAGVNSAFLALTLPEMSPDPADDTNALLLHLATGGNRNITSADDLPSASFSPASGIFPINVLLSLSLTLALVAAFLAVLGQHWLVYYRKRSGGGAEAQRWEQLRRYLGAERWRLEAILDDVLPSLLQVGLAIFCIAFALYLRMLDRWMCYVVAIPMGLALACILLMAISAALDHWCPFKSPLSRVLQLIPPSLVQPGWHAILSSLSWALTVAGTARDGMRSAGRAASPVTQLAMQSTLYIRPRALKFSFGVKGLARTMSRFGIRSEPQKPEDSPPGPSVVPVEPQQRYTSDLVSRLAESIPRPAEPIDRLKAIAAKRVLCTSEDFNALIYAAVNLEAMKSVTDIEWLLSDSDFYNRLAEMVKVVPYLCQGGSKALLDYALRSAFVTLVFSSGSPGFFIATDLELAPFPPLPTHHEGFQQVIHNLPEIVSRIAGQMRHLGPQNFKNMTTAKLGLEMINIALSPHGDDAVLSRFYAWCIEYANMPVPRRADAQFERFSVYLLACAIEVFNTIRPKLSSGGARTDRLQLLSKEKDYAEWAFHIACRILGMYRKCDEKITLSLVMEVLATFQLDRSSRPPNTIYILLLRQVGTLVSNPGFTIDYQTRASLSKSMITMSNVFIRFAQHSALGEPESEPTKIRDGVEHCIGIIGETLRPGMVSSLSLPLIHLGAREGLSEMLKDFLELVTDGLKRRMDLFDEALSSKILGLETSFIRWPRNRRDKDYELTEHQKGFLVIKSILNDMVYKRPAYLPPWKSRTLLLSARPAARSENPADAPSTKKRKAVLKPLIPERAR